MAQRSRSRTIAVIAGLLLVVVLLLLFFRRDPEVDARPSAAPPSASDDPIAVREETIRTPIARANPEQGLPGAPIIDEIILEKEVVCEGEENLVTIRAHTPDPADEAYLHYAVVGSDGSSVPLRLNQWSAESGPVDRKITVFGRDNVATTVDLPDYRIEKCQPARQLLVERGLNPNTEGEFWFSARILDIAAPTAMASPIRYHWTFGDGTREETDVPFVEHDFAERPQDAMYAQLLVACLAVAADGEQLLGRTSVQLLNPAYEHLTARGVVLLLVKLTPRFPQVSFDGVVRQGVRLWHWHDAPITIDSVRAVRLVRAGGERTEEVTPESVLGTRTIPPAGIEITAELDTNAEPDLFGINYYLSGTASGGLRVHGSFSVLRPPDAPTRASSRPVMSEYFKAKILRARKLLNQDVVTDEDILRLEKQGHFDDLHPEDFPEPAPEPEPNRPAPTR